MKGFSWPHAPKPSRRSLAFQRLAACLLALLVLRVPGINAQRASKSGGIDGFWQLTAEFPDYDLTSTVLFKTGADAQSVEGIVLGPTSGRAGSFAGSVSRTLLSLTAPGTLGEMRVNLTVSDNTLSGTWSTAELVGHIRGFRGASRKPEPNYYPKYLRTVCQILRDDFYDPHLNGVDLQEVTAKYAAQLANGRDDGEFVTLIRRLLGELKTSHTDFFLAPDAFPVNEKTPLITSRSLSPETYYLRIRHFDPPSAQNFNQAIDNALEEAAKYPSLVMDLRGNRGGNLGLVYRSLGHFLQAGRDAGYAFGRRGSSEATSISNAAWVGTSGLPVVRSSSSSIIGEIIRNGAAVIRIDAGQKSSYQGRLVILVDEGCYSGCEVFAATLRESGRAVLIGNRTGGEALGSVTYTVVKNLVFTKKDTGWRLEVPVVDFRTVGGERLEGNGVKPDIEVPKGGGSDAVLAEAIKYLGRVSARQNESAARLPSRFGLTSR